jgi:hypothetical protein
VAVLRILTLVLAKLPATFDDGAHSTATIRVVQLLSKLTEHHT